MKPHVALAASAAALLALCATTAGAAGKPASPPQDQCFWTRDADSFAAADEHTLNVRVNTHDVYQFEMLGTCQDIDWSRRIVLISRASPRICTGMDAEVISHSQIGPQHCAVTHMRKLTPAEIAALPRYGRP